MCPRAPSLSKHPVASPGGVGSYIALRQSPRLKEKGKKEGEEEEEDGSQ